MIVMHRIAVLMEFYSIHSDDATYNKLMLAFFKEQKMDLVSKVIEKAISRWKHGKYNGVHVCDYFN